MICMRPLSPQAKAAVLADPESAKVGVQKQQLEKLLQAYADLPAGAEYQAAMAAFQAAATAYNDIDRKIDALWAEKMQLISDIKALEQQMAEARVS